MSIETRLVDCVLARCAQEPSALARAAARTFILDTFGVALSGTRVEALAAVGAAAEAWGDGSAARVWGTGRAMPAGSAAFINAYLVHNQEFDCLHERAVLHPMAIVLSTLLAWAEQYGPVSGRDLVRAACIGVDMAVTIGASADNALRFFRPATASALGATAGVAVLARMDRATLLNALGLTYSQLSGTMQAHVEGSPVLALQMGFNARAVLGACELARRGLPGPQHFLCGPFGYYRLFDPDFAADRFEELLARPDHIAELSHKPFPSGRATHGAVDGLLELQRAHGFAAAHVAEVLVRAPPLVIQLVDRPVHAAMSAAHARLCLPYVAATGLLNGSVEVADFDDAALRDPQRLSLARCVRVERNEQTSLNALAPQQVNVRLRSGAALSIDLPAVLGSPARPLTSARHREKFQRCCASARPAFDPQRTAALAACVERIEELPDVRELIDHLAPEAHA